VIVAAAGRKRVGAATEAPLAASTLRTRFIQSRSMCEGKLNISVKTKWSLGTFRVKSDRRANINIMWSSVMERGRGARSDPRASTAPTAPNSQSERPLVRPLRLII